MEAFQVQPNKKFLCVRINSQGMSQENIIVEAADVADARKSAAFAMAECGMFDREFVLLPIYNTADKLTHEG